MVTGQVWEARLAQAAKGSGIGDFAGGGLEHPQRPGGWWHGSSSPLGASSRPEPPGARRAECPGGAFDRAAAPMVCLTIGWSEPKLTGPAVTVRVFRRTTCRRSAQYLPLIGPKTSSRSLWPDAKLVGDHAMSSGVQILAGSAIAGLLISKPFGVVTYGKFSPR